MCRYAGLFEPNNVFYDFFGFFPLNGSGTGAGTALGVSIMIAKILGLKLPLDNEVILTVSQP
jgi:hypothetical protein